VFQTRFSSVSVRPRLLPSRSVHFVVGIGAIIGQVVVGLICDRVGRKVALVGTTLLIVIGATLGTAAHGAHGSPAGLFWFLTFARGITGIVSSDSMVCTER
jgi:MFS family permease